MDIEQTNHLIEKKTPYQHLGPDTILKALEEQGFRPSGSMIALNSYENRVYQIGLEDESFCVVKFYRPNRWNDKQILEEHSFTNELLEKDLSVIAPYSREGETLFSYDDFRFSVFPRQGGHPPNIENKDDLKVLARSIARLHSIGQVTKFKYRNEMDLTKWAAESRESILNQQIIPLEMTAAYDSITLELIDKLGGLIESYKHMKWNRIHGDFHLGNVLWRNNTAHFLDFDDSVNGPPIQDLWMLLSGERNEQEHQLYEILDAYSSFADFDQATLRLVEPLRTLRIMHHAAWIGRRWNDPAFPPAFPWYNTNKYWSDHVLSLRQQLFLLEEPSLNPN